MHGLKLLSQNGTLTEKEKCSLMSLEELSHVNMIVHLIQGCITGHTQISCEFISFVCACVCLLFPFPTHKLHHTPQRPLYVSQGSYSTRSTEVPFSGTLICLIMLNQCM